MAHRPWHLGMDIITIIIFILGGGGGWQFPPKKIPTEKKPLNKT